MSDPGASWKQYLGVDRAKPFVSSSSCLTHRCRESAAGNGISPGGDEARQKRSETITACRDREPAKNREKRPQKRTSCLPVLTPGFRWIVWWANQGSILGPTDYKVVDPSALDPRDIL